jgi:hypothetical protein
MTAFSITCARQNGRAPKRAAKRMAAESCAHITIWLVWSTTSVGLPSLLLLQLPWNPANLQCQHWQLPQHLFLPGISTVLLNLMTKMLTENSPPFKRMMLENSPPLNIFGIAPSLKERISPCMGVFLVRGCVCPRPCYMCTLSCT